MDLHPRRLGDEVVLEVRGEIDAHTSPVLRQALRDLAAHRGPVVLDMTRVRFIDTSGAGALVQGQAAIRERGGQMTIVVSEGRILELLRLLELEPILANRCVDVLEVSPAGR